MKTRSFIRGARGGDVDEQRISRLEAQVEELTRAVKDLQAQRLVAPGAGASSFDNAAHLTVAGEDAARADELDPLPQLVPDGVTHVGIFALLGRSFLALGGAFLIRALTDAKALPPAAGLALGFSFALALCFLADRAFGRADRLSALFHASTGALVAYPLVWESSARLHLISAPGSAAALAIYSLALLVVARRRAAVGLAWLSICAGLAGALALLISTDALGAITAALLVLLAAALWLSGDGGIPGLAWPVALLLDVIVVRLAGSIATQGELDIGQTGGVALALCLPVLLAASLGLRRAVWEVDPGVFEWLMVPLGVGVGLYSAVSLGDASSRTLAGALSLALAIASYAAAFAHRARTLVSAQTIHFHALLGLLLALVGSALLGGGAIGGAAFGLVGLVAALLADRLPGSALSIQGAAWLIASALSSGLLVFSLGAFVGEQSAPFARFDLPAILSLSFCAVAAVIALRRHDRAGPIERAVRAAMLALVAISVDGLLAAFGSRLLGEGHAGALATMRTAVLAASALGLAAASRKLSARELAWLSFATLALGGLKLAIQDLPSGRPLTLVLGFALYGLALIFAPRLARPSGSPAPLSS